ncbi:acyl-CoA synthetase [Thalassotalea maritima]|uniref:acyl-CoA synthetase n=1 Tax=Thalassotalea maritima TaxID=3242416 RepID=UPI003526EAF4
MTSFDDVLIETAQGWQWQLPSHFNIADACIRQHVQAGHGDRTALIVEDDKLGCQQLSYQQLDHDSAKLASVLASLNIEPGDRVLIRLPNATDYPVSFFGCLKHGAIAVPTSTLLSANEVAYLAQDSGAKVLITSKHMWPELKTIAEQDNQLTSVLLAGTGDMPQSNSRLPLFDLNALLSQASARDDIINSRIDDAAYLVYTSGTTGYPKGVLHAHRSLLGRLPASRYWFDFKHGDRIMHSGKFNWTYVLGSALMDPLFHGHTVIVHEGDNDASTWPKLIKKHDCTIFIGVPTIYRQIIQKTTYSKADVPSLRHCMSAGEHLSDEMLSAWRQRFGMDVFEAIGMSECSYYISQNKHQAIRPGAAGFVQPGHQVTLLNEQNQPAQIGEEAMIAIKQTDPGLFMQYWQLPEATNKAFHDGYFYTGDYARLDEDGYIWFVGRKDDIINTFGYRVSPHEIERIIKTHPDVADCVALGQNIGNDKTLVCACVILREGAKVSEQQLLSFADANLAKYKAPKIIHFYQDFPRTKNGKVLRKQMLAELHNAKRAAV